MKKKFKMDQKNFIITISVCVWLLLSRANSQELTISETSSSSASRSNEQVGAGNIWILVPSNINFTDAYLNEPENYNLLKLDTSLLSATDTVTSFSENLDENFLEASMNGGSRESRKINLFRKPWFRPKGGQLFLANGTVCRYVNSVPICTFISNPVLQPNRQGIPFGNNMNNMMNPNMPNGNMNNMNPNTNNMNQNMNNMNNPNLNNMNNNNQFIPQGNRQMNNQGALGGNNQQQFRPMAVLDNDSTELNVEAAESSSSNSTSSSSTSGQPMTNTQFNSKLPVNSVQTTRPLNLYGRRPLNLLPFRRPLNTQYQMLRGHRKDSNGQSS